MEYSVLEIVYELADLQNPQGRNDAVRVLLEYNADVTIVNDVCCFWVD